MDPIRFTSHSRYWNPDKASGLAVADIPGGLIQAFGGLNQQRVQQQRVRGRMLGVEFAANVMPAGGGRLALGVSKAMMSVAGVGVGDEAEVEIAAIGPD